MNYPWLRKIPWYKKLHRLLHCTMSMLGLVVYLGYLIDDLEYLIKEAELPKSRTILRDRR